MLFIGLFVIFFGIGIVIISIGIFINNYGLDMDFFHNTKLSLSEFIMVIGTIFLLLSGITMLAVIILGIFKLGFWLMSLIL